MKNDLNCKYPKSINSITALLAVAVAVKYTDCISAEGNYLSTNECPRYETKQSDGEGRVLALREMWSTP